MRKDDGIDPLIPSLIPSPHPIPSSHPSISSYCAHLLDFNGLLLSRMRRPSFLPSPESLSGARDLRPLLVTQLVSGLDLLLRDRVRKLYTITLPSLAPRLPFIGELMKP